MNFCGMCVCINFVFRINTFQAHSVYPAESHSRWLKRRTVLYIGAVPSKITNYRNCLCGFTMSELVLLQETNLQNSLFRPVNLTYDVFDGKGDNTPLVFLHGLFGSKSNFHSIAKSLVQRTGRKVLHNMQ